jgi:hypothetical protein
MREEIPSGAKTPFLGENPAGFLHYMPEGRMLALITRAGRTAPAGKVANAAEAEALIRSMISYGGTYECGENEVIVPDRDRLRRAPQWPGRRLARNRGARTRLPTDRRANHVSHS